MAKLGVLRPFPSPRLVPLEAALAFVMAGCMGASGSSTSDTGGSKRTPTSSSPTSSIVPSRQPGGAGVQPGTLTAGAWDDNLNFDFFRRYLDEMAAVDGQDPAWPFVARADRMDVVVTNELGAPLGDAAVVISGPSGTVLLARTRSDGHVFVLPSWYGLAAGTPLVVSATLGPLGGEATALAGDPRAAVTIVGAAAALPATLEIALVIDTTGSMGDEMSYLKVELEHLASEVRDRYPGVNQRFALIAYRDVGDAYVVRSYDFTPGDATFRVQLQAQSATGGGDYPESPDLALAALQQLSWSPVSAARVVFWVADAPHHADRTQVMLTDFKQASERGLHIYPVASSGVDELTELTMRTGAQLTGGRYLFLTDDSGIGDSHKIPTIPCYVVTTLEKAMLRMIFMEISGVHVEPAPTDVVRTAGSPADGRCIEDDGQQTSWI